MNGVSSHDSAVRLFWDGDKLGECDDTFIHTHPYIHPHTHLHTFTYIHTYVLIQKYSD